MNVIGAMFHPIEDDQEAGSRKACEAPPFELQLSDIPSWSEVYREGFEAKTSNNRRMTFDIRAALRANI